MIAASEPPTPVLVSQALETPWMGPGSTELLLNPQIPPPAKAWNSRPTPTVNSQPEQGAGWSAGIPRFCHSRLTT